MQKSSIFPYVSHLLKQISMRIYILGGCFIAASIFLLVSIFFNWGGVIASDAIFFFSKLNVLIASIFTAIMGLSVFTGMDKPEDYKYSIGYLLFASVWHFLVVLGDHPLIYMGFTNMVEDIKIIWYVAFCLPILFALLLISRATK